MMFADLESAELALPGAAVRIEDARPWFAICGHALYVA
jgi:hypothetical protein